MYCTIEMPDGTREVILFTTITQSGCNELEELFLKIGAKSVSWGFQPPQ